MECSPETHFVALYIYTVSDKFTLSPERLTWRKANAHCMSIGGYLAADDDLKNPNLIKVTETTSERLWYGEYYTPWIWLKGRPFTPKLKSFGNYFLCVNYSYSNDL